MAYVLSECIFLFSLKLLNPNPIILYPIVTKWGGSKEVKLENSEIQPQQFMTGFSGNSNPFTGVQQNIGFSRTSAVNSSKPRWLKYCRARVIAADEELCEPPRIYISSICPAGSHVGVMSQHALLCECLYFLVQPTWKTNRNSCWDS